MGDLLTLDHRYHYEARTVPSDLDARARRAFAEVVEATGMTSAEIVREARLGIEPGVLDAIISGRAFPSYALLVAVLYVAGRPGLTALAAALFGS